MSKKVLLIIPNFGFGGAQRVFANHSKLFSKFSEVEDCVFNLSDSQKYTTNNILHSLEVKEGKSFLEKAFRFVERIYRLRELKKTQKYDICISHLEGADYINVLSRQSEKIILVIHGSKSGDENIKGLIGWLRKKVLLPILYRKADLIITVSDGIKEELIGDFYLPSSRILSIPNYFNIEEIIEKSNEKSDSYIKELKRINKIILYSGRFATQKNLIPLFQIFKEVRKNGMKVKLVMLGDGELKDDLLLECSGLGFRVYKEGLVFNEEYDVYFLGYYSNPFPVIKQSDVFVMTSKWEGFPMALCEAMAIGTCVIASDCPTGPREILHYRDEKGQAQQAGILLPVPLVNNKDTLQIWVSTLTRLLDSEELRSSFEAKAKERVKCFSEEIITLKWKTILS